MIEEVLDNLISWHDVKMEDLPETLDFIRENFGYVTITVAEEYWYNPSFFCAIKTNVENMKTEEEIKQ